MAFTQEYMDHTTNRLIQDCERQSFLDGRLEHACAERWASLASASLAASAVAHAVKASRLPCTYSASLPTSRLASACSRSTCTACTRQTHQGGHLASRTAKELPAVKGRSPPQRPAISLLLKSA